MRVTSLVLPLLLAAASGCTQASNPEPGRTGGADTSRYDQVMLALPVGDARAGRQALLDLKCTTCHPVGVERDFPAPFGANLGPDLGGRPPHRSPSDLATAIVAPSHAVSVHVSPDVRARFEGTLSPMGNFNQAMTVQQLSDMVAYLRSIGTTP